MPTAAGWMLALTLLVLLIASINYQLNLGYLLTFLIAGAGVVGMHVCHGNLRGLTLQLSAPSPFHAGSACAIDLRVTNSDERNHYAIALAVLDTEHWLHIDVPAQGSTPAQISHSIAHRGWHALPLLTAETRYPLGTFRVWTIWRPATQVLVYPAIEPHAPPLPPGEPVASGEQATRVATSGEFDGVRAYQRGDPLRAIVWKKAAKSDELVTRDTVQHQRVQLWLDYKSCGAGTHEAKLSRLCAWVIMAEKNGVNYGLRLATRELPAAQGEAHKRRCLEALALC